MAIITLQDIRDQGLTEEEASDDELTLAIAAAEEDLREYTGGRWFEPIEFPSDSPLLLDGTGTDTIVLPVPIIRLDSVSEDGAELSIADLAVYGYVDRRPDNRGYARICKRGVIPSPLADAWGTSSRVWKARRQVVALVGSFGYVEADGTSSPPLVKKAALRLALREWRPLTDPLESESHATGQVMSETTDMHSYTLGGVKTSSGPTGNVEIDRILARYALRSRGGTTRSYG